MVDLPNPKDSRVGESILDWCLAKRAVRSSLVIFGSEFPVKDVSNQRTVIPFPLARRHSLVRNLALAVARRSCSAGERYLKSKLRRYIDNLHYECLCDLAVEREVRALELAVRAELWNLILLRPNSNL